MSASATPLTGYQKVLLGLLALLQFTVLFDFLVLAPLGDVLMKSLRIGPAQFSLAGLYFQLLMAKETNHCRVRNKHLIYR